MDRTSENAVLETWENATVFPLASKENEFYRPHRVETKFAAPRLSTGNLRPP